MIIQKGSLVQIVRCATPMLNGLVGKVVRKPRNSHYIVKFVGDGQLYIFSDTEIKEVK